MANSTANKETIENIKSDLKASTEKTAEQIGRVAQDTWEKGRDTVSKVLDSVGSSVKEGCGQAEKAVESAISETRDAIKKHPVQALVVGFGVGCLVGLTVRRLFSVGSK